MFLQIYKFINSYDENLLIKVKFYKKLTLSLYNLCFITISWKTNYPKRNEWNAWSELNYYSRIISPKILRAFIIKFSKNKKFGVLKVHTYTNNTKYMYFFQYSNKYKVWTLGKPRINSSK